MRCREAREAVLGGRALSAPAREHLRVCASCESLGTELSRSYVGAQAGATQAELDALLGRVERAIEGEEGGVERLRSIPTGWRLLIASSATAATVAAVALVSPRVDLGVYPEARLLLSALAFVGLLAALIALGLRPLHVPERSTRAILFALVALAMPFSIALLPEARLAHAVVMRDAHDCLLVGTICGAALMVLLRALDRSSPDARSFLVPAAAGGVLANLVLHFHCPVLSPLHLAVIHAPIGLVLLLGHRGFRSAALRIARVRGS